MALCWQAPARASSTPPTIENIVGTYLVTDKEVYYSLDECVPIKENCVLTWRIAQTSDSTVQVYVDEWDWLFTAYYKGGFLVESSQDINGVGVGIALFSGKPGKVRFKGDFGWGQFGGVDDYYRWDHYVGKMTSTSPTSSVKAGATLASQDSANQDDEQEVLEAEEQAGPLATASTSGIDELPGTYWCNRHPTMYLPWGETISEHWTITKIDGETLNINWSWRSNLNPYFIGQGGDVRAHYGCGILMVVEPGFGILLGKGKPGKISLKGYTTMGFGTIDDGFGVTKVSCKYSSGS
jgi:hypothetical protein